MPAHQLHAGKARRCGPGGLGGARWGRHTLFWCLQAGGLERRQLQDVRQSEDMVSYGFNHNALQGVVLVGDLGFGARGEMPRPYPPPWLKIASEMRMGEDW